MGYSTHTQRMNAIPYVKVTTPAKVNACKEDKLNVNKLIKIQKHALVKFCIRTVSPWCGRKVNNRCFLSDRELASCLCWMKNCLFCSVFVSSFRFFHYPLVCFVCLSFVCSSSGLKCFFKKIKNYLQHGYRNRCWLDSQATPFEQKGE